MANWKNNSANMLNAIGNVADGLKGYHEALSLYEEILGAESGMVVSTKFNIAGVEENAEHWDEAEKYYRESIQLAGTVWPDSNEDVQMFRAAYGLFLNKRGRFTEAAPLFRLVIAHADKNPEFSDDDVFKATQLGLAIALYATERSPAQAAEFTRAAQISKDMSFETIAAMRDQVSIAKQLGLPVPSSGPLVEAPKTEGKVQQP
jgi:tetratricopeptide (TPR) repeat protein